MFAVLPCHCYLTAGVAKLRPADQFHPARQVPCAFFQVPRSDCGQQCDSIGCCLPRKSHCVRPFCGQAVANLTLGSKSLANPVLLRCKCKASALTLSTSESTEMQHISVWEA